MNWLPDLVLFNDYGGDWGKYVEALYQYFCHDFIQSSAYYQGQKLALKRHPIILGKEATFWHLISEGNTEAERTPDLRRCERIRWPKPIIEKSHAAPSIKVWENTRNHEKRICLWLEEKDYLVVLAERKGYLLLWTAYFIEYAHRKKKLQEEFEQFIALKKADAASR